MPIQTVLLVLLDKVTQEVKVRFMRLVVQTNQVEEGVAQLVLVSQEVAVRAVTEVKQHLAQLQVQPFHTQEEAVLELVLHAG